MRLHFLGELCRVTWRGHGWTSFLPVKIESAHDRKPFCFLDTDLAVLEADGHLRWMGAL